jgi:hypothetical protein
MRRAFAVLVLTILGLTFTSATSYAQQSVTFSIGRFVPHGEDGRLSATNGAGDVLVNNLDFLAFRISDFNGVTFSGEYVVGLGRWIDAGFGAGYYRRTVPSVYANLMNEDGTEIEQNLQLRIVPWTATVRFLPLGRTGPVQPYVGGGVGVFQWRYSEVGQFVAEDQTIFSDSFAGSGVSAGPVFLGGVQFPIGSLKLGGEVRYQKAEGDLPADQGFSSNKIDLGGWTYAATVGIRF